MLQKLFSTNNLKSALIERINSIIDYLNGERLIQGPGILLERRAAGTVISVPVRHGWSVSYGSSDSWDGPFSIRYDPDAELLRIKGGWLMRNGTWISIPEKTLEAATGIVVLDSHIEVTGEHAEWTEPEIKFGSPSATAFPLGEVKIQDDNVIVKSYRSAVAVIMSVKVCPIAKQNQETS